MALCHWQRFDLSFDFDFQRSVDIYISVMTIIRFQVLLDYGRTAQLSPPRARPILRFKAGAMCPFNA
jgi:hypothetical protein